MGKYTLKPFLYIIKGSAMISAAMLLNVLKQIFSLYYVYSRFQLLKKSPVLSVQLLHPRRQRFVDMFVGSSYPKTIYRTEYLSHFLNS